MLFFFYGSLMDGELRRALAGRKAGRLRVTPGVLVNYRRRRARFGDYPVLVPGTGGRVPGLFVEGLDTDLLLWVAHFEGPGYLPDRVAARDLAGRRLAPWAFLPETRDGASDDPWDFAAWQRGRKPQVRRLLEYWLLESTAGRPLALDAPWRVRRRLAAIAAAGDDQPRPNPELGTAMSEPAPGPESVSRLLSPPVPVAEAPPWPAPRKVA